MKVFFPRELAEGEARVPIIPEAAKKLSAKGLDVVVEQGIGAALGFDDAAYADAGARAEADRDAQLAEADLVVRLNKPEAGAIGPMKRGAMHLSFLNPFNEHALVDAMAEQGLTGMSVEMIPRTTIAQKMDALSSQANIAGYYAVILAAQHLDQVFPMMMTPAGTLKPSRVFVIGAGVAGLQAIATAKRLGARVEAFDTRPVVKEQVQSLGAKFIEIDLGETGQTEGGYAKELTDEQKELQQQGMAKVIAQSDVVITTAKLFGRKAPVIVTRDMVEAMRPGSVVVDMAIESGGNVEGAVLGEAADVAGTKVLGYPCLEGRLPVHASEMYASNVTNFILHFWDDDEKTFRFDLSDEVLAGCVITHDGAVVNPAIAEFRAKQEG